MGWPSTLNRVYKLASPAMSRHTLCKSGFLEHLKAEKTKKNCIGTVWKFQDFSVTQILCEINFGETRTSKTALLEALNFATLVNLGL